MTNPFANFFKSSREPLSKKPVTSALGIDIGSSSIKVVQLRQEKGRVKLETYGELAVGPYDNLAIGQTSSFTSDKLIPILTDLFREAGVTTSTAAFSIPLKSSLILVVEMPDLSPEDLAKAIPIEARKYVPVPITEVALDWQIIPRGHQEFLPVATENKTPLKTKDPALSTTTPLKKTDVLLAAIHREIISLYTTIAQGMKLEPRFFEIESFSALRSAVPSSNRAPVAVIDMGASATKMTIVDSGIVRISHTIGKGSQDITAAISKSLGVDYTKAEEIKREFGLTRAGPSVRSVDADTLNISVIPIVEYIFAEANRVVVNYQRRYKRSVDRALLLGGGALLKGAVDIAVRRLGVDVAVARPFGNLSAPEHMSQVLEEAGPSFAVAIGLAERLLNDA